ncbi:hypothetical protein CVT25_011415 [Psilocybe cyanescens]|uniref:Late embryogenesis abundant protein LEA-2 subgroup domain-containing protein n=1 Tax=Psilocybe cyanescens TaxID=93625 RepID=A0A409WGD2_PSICY|nr:hypothetical protein CVT25_011415 [Psilocybe cyanescens]
MARFNKLLAFLGGFLVAVNAAPATSDSNILTPADIINALGVGLVKDINAFITLDSLTTNIISVNFDVKNPLAIELTLDSVSAVAGLNGTTFATFTHKFPAPGLVVPPLATKNSGTINNVMLPQGAEASLVIIPFGILDLPDTNANVRAFTIDGFFGTPIPLDGLKQTAVPTNLVAASTSASPATQAADLGIADIINALGVGLVKDINAFVTLESLTTNVISVNFDVKNPLPIELTLDSVDAVAGLNGTIFATFSHTFAKPGLVVPPLGTKNSGTINNVLLPQGADASLAIIPFQILDLPNTNANVRAATIAGVLGIPITLTGLKQTAVPTNYTLELD